MDIPNSTPPARAAPGLFRISHAYSTISNVVAIATPASALAQSKAGIRIAIRAAATTRNSGADQFTNMPASVAVAIPQPRFRSTAARYLA